jgi:1-acyl-sn-glycerol-3-phosphate acyltransferase
MNLSLTKEMQTVIRTIIYAVYFGTLVLFSQLVFLLPYYLMKWLGLRRAAGAFIRLTARWMGWLVMKGTGARVTVKGRENLPRQSEGLCFVSNHQGIFDIPLVVGYIPVLMGFIAKIELKKIPFLNTWLWALGCILLNRKSPRSAIIAIRDGVERIKGGQSLCIFPEGTRSRSNRMGHFKPGSLKLAFRSHAVIVPLTIKNSYKVFEERGRIRPADVFLYIHPPLKTEGLSDQDQKELSEFIRAAIEEPLAQQE